MDWERVKQEQLLLLDRALLPPVAHKFWDIFGGAYCGHLRPKLK